MKTTAFETGQVILGTNVLREWRVLPALEEARIFVLRIFVLTGHALPAQPAMEMATAFGIGRVVLGADVLRERKVLPALEEARIFVLTSHVLPGTTRNENACSNRDRAGSTWSVRFKGAEGTTCPIRSKDFRIKIGLLFIAAGY